MRIEHNFTLDDLVKSLYYKPNGQEYVCKLCHHIELSKEKMYLHIYNKQVRDLE